MLFNYKVGAVAAATILVLMGCSHTPPLREYADTASPSEEIQKLDTDMSAADQNQVGILSPVNYAEAQSSMKDAKSDLDQQKDSAKTLHEVAKARAYLQQALSVADLAHANIDDVIIARKQAIVAGSPKRFDKEFAAADKNLSGVTKSLEKNDLSPATKDRSSLQNQYLVLELNTIKATNLQDARGLIDQSIAEGAKSSAPRSLAIAEKSYKDAEAYITANRHNSEVKIHADDALASANHLLKITRASKSDKKISAEELALQMESEQGLVSTQQSELEKKDSELNRKNSEILKRDSVIQGKDNELNGAALALQVTSEKAAAKKDLDQKYESARAEFKESEAEVYKQGDDLVIRLKTIEFPKAKANLRASNFSLLAKVEKIIKSFSGCSVVIEGHTDSVGGKEANEKLSVARAEAVREYFIANQATAAGKITAIGYDYQKPLTSNKTSVGRAENRRVDVRIQPEPATSL